MVPMTALARSALGPLLFASTLVFAGPYGPASAAESSGVLTAKDRQKLALVVLTPRGEVAKPVISQLLELTTEALRPVTNLEPVEVSVTDKLRECKGRLKCIAPLAAIELERSLPMAGQLTDRPLYVLVISVLAQEGEPDRLTAILLNAREVEAIKHANPNLSDEEQESLVSESPKAVLASPASALSQNEEQARRYVERLIDQDFRTVFTSFGNWEPYGTIELVTTVDAATVMLDGQTIGVARGGVTRIEQVAGGKRALRVETSGAAPFETQVVVEPQGVVRVEAELEEAGSGGNLARDLTFWGGLAIAAGGAALTVYGVAAQSSAVYTSNCLEVAGAPGCGSGREFLRFGFRTEADIKDAFAEDPNGGGPMIAPFGYSLVAAGGAMAAGTLLLKDRPELWWVPIVGGAALFAASYGLSAALDGSDGLPNPP